MASMTGERSVGEAQAGCLPVQLVASFSDTVDKVLAMGLSTSKREDIDARTHELIGYMTRLQGEDLGEDQSRDTLRLLGLVEKHLATSNRPSKRTQAHEAFNYMHDTAVFARALLLAYMTNKDSAS
ncbi:hypothetical protein ACIQPR_43490 [Streptomyces sp. NPDC091280]|uniref:hypothetical protein n=1 Tax=Streptomyces sp. NPDC091280 TaxID=3365984 RepID=UPI00382FBF97